MKLFWADCEATYTGRGDTKLPRHERLIIVKDDNSVVIHNDSGIKPLNYMVGKKNVTFTIESEESGNEIWIFDSPKESLHIKVHRIYQIIEAGYHDEDPGLQRDGTEDHLQEWLFNNLGKLLPGLKVTAREHRVGPGHVDLFGECNEVPVMIEVKRVATRDGARQAARYVEDHPGSIGILIALDVRPGAEDECIKKELSWIELDWDNSEGSIRNSFLQIDLTKNLTTE